MGLVVYDGESGWVLDKFHMAVHKENVAATREMVKHNSTRRHCVGKTPVYVEHDDNVALSLCSCSGIVNVCDSEALNALA